MRDGGPDRLGGSAIDAAPQARPLTGADRALRLALFPSFFYRRDPASGALRGVGIALAQALAEHVRAALSVAEYAAPPDAVRALAAGAADMGLLGIDRARAAEVDFSEPLFAADFTFLVPQHSAVRMIDDADRPGVRIALVRHHAMDTALRGKVPQAGRVYADTPDAAFDLFRAGGADVLAGIRPGLIAYAARASGLRVLADAYGRNVIAFATGKGAPLLAEIGDFVARAKVGGTIARAIAEAGLGGIDQAADRSGPR